jgi:hypothetical protein
MQDVLLSDSYEKKTLFSIADIVYDISDIPKEVLPLTKKEIRELQMREIYNFYVLERPKRKKENWKRYVKWLKENRIPDTKQNQAKFRRQKKFIREISYESLCWLLKHIPTEDLPYFTSTGREFYHSGKNFSGWLGKWFEKVVK